LAVLAAACSPGPEPEPEVAAAAESRAASVVFVVLDTLRADHMSLYGYERPTTPELVRFAGGATLYRRAQAAGAWTLPSHASMFTGLYPFQHGAHAKLAPNKKRPTIIESVLSKEHTTLAEVLQAQGFATAAIAANKGYLSRRFQLDQGFDEYELEAEPGERITARALDWLQGRPEGPFFLFLNYMDVHSPYNCTPRGEFQPAVGHESARDLYVAFKERVLPAREPVPEGLRRDLVEQYDTALANLDHALGVLFEGLRELGLFDDCLIVVTSDHGEYLGEKHLVAHSKDVYQGVLHVPLVVKSPGQREGAVDEDWISHVHLPGLVLSELDPEGRWGGGAFRQHWPRGRVLSENYYARGSDLKSPWGARFERVRRAVLGGDWKYIHSSDGAHELYDLGRDRLEEHDLESAPGTPAAALASWLEALVQATPVDTPGASEEPVPATPEELEALRALGYVDDE